MLKNIHFYCRLTFGFFEGKTSGDRSGNNISGLEIMFFIELNLAMFYTRMDLIDFTVKLQV